MASKKPLNSNFGDTFPARNLGDPAAPWGREVEKRLKFLEKYTTGVEQAASSTERTLSTVANSLVNQGNRIEEVADQGQVVNWGLSGAFQNLNNVADELQNQVDFVVESADGKNTNYLGPNAPTPPTGGFKEGDIWFDNSDPGGIVIKVWSGTVWKIEPLGPSGIADDAITSTKITNGAIETSKLSANAITSDKIAANAVSAGKIAANSIVAGDGVIASLDAGVISTGILDADRIGAKSILADKLLIGMGNNVLPNAALDLGESGSNNDVPGWPNWTRSTSNGPNGEPSIRVQASPGRHSEYFPVEAGTEYFFSFEAQAQFANTRFYVQLQTNGASDPYILSNINIPSVNTWFPHSGTVTIPVGATEARIRVDPNHSNSTGDRSGYQWFTKWRLTPMVGGTLIEDGAITTDKIFANAITADKIATNAVTADKIQANAIDGKTITGATIRTAASGERVEMTSAEGLRYTHPTYGSIDFGPTDYIPGQGAPVTLKKGIRFSDAGAVPNDLSASIVGNQNSVYMGASSPGQATLSGQVSVSGGTASLQAYKAQGLDAGQSWLIVESNSSGPFSGRIRTKGAFWIEKSVLTLTNSHCATGFVISSWGVVTLTADGWVDLAVNVTGNIPVGTIDVLRALPAQYRPGVGNRQGAAWLSSGHGGTAFIRPAGTVAVSNQTGAARSSVQFQIVFYRGW